ncbi:hypothetical protein FJT64_010363 [Amphibalanus amphitrite]|uniref:Death domain-containing protein n=1 Tax=Amphibalanus amphitrite TaxID=1232801 RepID=A0A6A4VJ35_AMPAM|nr:hypothetical protein FJT64_010363 [Amphibalanus amphitrite]
MASQALLIAVRLCSLLPAGALAAVPQAALQVLADSLSRDQCVQLVRQLAVPEPSGRLDQPCLSLLRRWNRPPADVAELSAALRDLGQLQLAEALTRRQHRQGAAALADSLRAARRAAATEQADDAEEQLGADSDDSERRPAGRDRPPEPDGFGASGAALLLTALFLTAAAVCFCAGRSVCPGLAHYDPAARRRRRQSVSGRVNQMLRAQRVRGKMALLTGLPSVGGRSHSQYAPLAAEEAQPSVPVAPTAATLQPT